MPGSVQTLLSLTAALLTVYLLFRALRLDSLLDSVRNLVGSFGRGGRILAVVFLVAGAVFSVSKEPLRSSPSPQQPSLPEWFTALGYDPADTDGDGIPDCWERWTRTDRAVADANLDPDGDGVDNFAEFWNQCDPMCADTDGDGIDDATEIAGLAAGVPDLNPLVRATFPAAGTGGNGGGVPDVWQYAETNLFAGVDANGFPLGCAVLAEGESNYDVLLTVSSSQYALLTWGGGAGAFECLLPPCTNLELRVRLDSGDTQTPTLRAAPAYTTNAVSGTWRATLSAAWDARRQQSTEGNRVSAGGTMVDCEAEGCSASFRGAFGAGDGTLSLPFVPKWMYLNGTGSWSCWEHEAPPPVELVETNIPPPYIWSSGGGETESLSHVFSPGSPEFYTDGMTVHCREADATHTNLVLETSIVLTADHCPQPVTNIVGAASGSTHNPTNATDHLSGAEPDSIWRHSPDCPPTTNVLVKIGWDHGKVNTRNLPVISTGDWRDTMTDHCLALEWRADMTIDFASYLNDEALDFIDRIHFKVDGSTAERNYSVQGKPGARAPIILHVQVFAEGAEALDSLWIVVFKPSDKTEFNTWYTAQSADISWTASLPKPCHALVLNGDNVSAGPGATGTWSSPDNKVRKTYMHHNAAYEMRTHMEDTHGNQATFDESGAIIKTGIRAGTADYYAPYDEDGDLRWDFNHRNYDVYPYIRALLLDGNPSPPTLQWIPQKLARPPLFQGEYAGKYLTCRPTIY